MGLIEGLAAGDQNIHVSKLDDAPAPRKAKQGRGARSQAIGYKVGGDLIAICHQYRLRDGTLGGKGRPDPKWLRVGPVIWIPSHDDLTHCDDCPPPDSN